jgi:anti-sigma factor RsiW
MRATAETQTIRSYLLGALPEDDKARLEAAYFDDPALADDIAAVEHDLLDEYVRQELSVEERRRFEQYYLASPLHRERTAVAAALRAASGAHAPDATVPERFPRPARSPRVVALLARTPARLRWFAAAAAIVAGFFWWWTTAITPDHPNEVRQVQSEAPSPSGPLTAAPPEATTPPTKEPSSTSGQPRREPRAV